MQPTKELIDELYREEIERARRMSPEQKVLAGFELFDLMTKVMVDGIRDQFPDASEERVKKILHERLALARQLENCS